MTPDDRSAAFFATLEAQADAAERRCGEVVRRHYAIAGLGVALHLAGPRLEAPLTRAIAHLAVPPFDGPADLTIRIWDCAALGLDYPRAPVGMEAFTPRGEVRGLSEPYLLSFAQQGRLLSAMVPGQGRAFYCVADGADIPRFEAAEPLRALIGWLLHAHGRQFVHAAAVGTEHGGVLMIGRSGSGKSNTSLACVGTGLRFASDDFCAVSTAGPPVVHSLYSTGKTRPADWARHPGLAALAPDFDPAGADKVIHYLHEAKPDSIITAFPLRAVLAVRRGAGRCRTEAIPVGRAVALCAPDTAMLVPGAQGDVLRRLAAVFRKVPCFQFVLGDDPQAVAPTLERLTHGLNAEANQPA